jgi:glycosyltransferase involved in cell wall biosynthesis
VPDNESVPRVAVVIPCFNDGAYVVDAVRSAEAQEPCEIVVVDDGSDDPHTIQVMDQLRETSVHVVRQENGGLSSARMAGVRASSARYVQPLDADDRLAPHSIADLADALDADPQATAAWGTTTTFGDSDFTSVHWSGFDPWRLTFVNEVPTTILVRRDALLEAGGWELNEAGYEDWDFNLSGAEKGWIGIRLDRPHSFYRQHGDSRMLGEAKRQHDELYDLLRRRHAPLFENRSRFRRASSTRWTLKLAWTAIDRLPGVSGGRKAHLFAVARDVFEPAMRHSDALSPWARVRRRFRT